VPLKPTALCMPWVCPELSLQSTVIFSECIACGHNIFVSAPAAVLLLLLLVCVRAQGLLSQGPRGPSSVAGRIKYCLKPTPLPGALSSPVMVSNRGDCCNVTFDCICNCCIVTFDCICNCICNCCIITVTVCCVERAKHGSWGCITESLLAGLPFSS